MLVHRFLSTVGYQKGIEFYVCVVMILSWLRYTFLQLLTFLPIIVIVSLKIPDL